MIVIVIMGVIYTLAITNLNTVAKKQEDAIPTIKNLKQFLLRFEFKNKIEFVCLAQQSNCFVILDNKTEKSIDEEFEKSEILAYRYNLLEGLREVAFEPYFDSNNIEKDVTFSYTLYKDKTGDQVIFVLDNKAYDYTSYLEDVVVYDSPELFVQTKEQLLQKVL